MDDCNRMGRRHARLARALACAAAVALSSAAAEAADDTLTLKWKDGLRIESADGKIQAKIGGRIQIDALGASFSPLAERELGLDDGSGVIFRRARINLDANFSDYFFKAEYDFAGGSGDTNFRDVYVGMRNLPGSSSVYVGHFKEPFSLEQLTSDNFTTFLERNLADNFTPARNTGAMWSGAPREGRIYWGVGGFRETSDFGDDYDDNDTWNLTGRLTGLPIANEDGSRLLHLGVAYSHKFTDEDEGYRVRARPGIQIPDRLFDTGAFETQNVDLFGAEGALVYGPASVQAEYINSLVDGDDGLRPNVDFWGSYVELSYFVTPGDHRGYKREAGAFDRVKPKSNFSLSGGSGAVQLAARFDFIDLEDETISGGRGWTAGPAINWYMTSNVRVTANYVHGDREGDGNSDGGGVRFQIDY